LAVDRHGHWSAAPSFRERETSGRRRGPRARDRRAGLGQPRGRNRPSGAAALFELLFGGGDFRPERVPARAIFGRRHHSTGGVSLMLPSITGCVVLLKNAAIS
jgi:hypothetical protein